MFQRSIWLMNIGKCQKDFEYIFTDIKIAGYINGPESTQELETLSTQKNVLLIICDSKQKTESFYASILKNYTIEYCFAEDFFERLDYNFSQNVGNREVLFCTESLNQYIKPTVFLDEKKYDTPFEGTIILNPRKFQSWKDYFIVVTVENPTEILYFLTEKGLLENIDYTWYKNLSNVQIPEGKAIAYYGCGHTAKTLLHHQKSLADRKISKIIPTSDLVHCDKEMHFVILVGTAHDKVPILKANNFKGLNDYIFLNYLFYLENNKPSDLLRDTFFAPSLEQANCNHPFYNTYISRTGDIFGCCPGWPRFGFGNIKNVSCDEAWHSIYARIFRLSIINRTFVFCRDTCGKINPQRLVSDDQDTRFNNTTKQNPSQVAPCMDYSCNLSCESCRNELQVAHGKDLKEIDFLGNQIITSPWLNNPSDILQLSGYGEVFASQVYKKLLFDTHKQNKEVQILSNGNLFTPEMFNRLIEKYGKIRVINISVDAASEKTYTKLRRGGNWHKLIENLKYIGEQRTLGNVGYFNINLTVQRDNYQEIPAFIQLGKSIHADTIAILPISNWGTYSVEEFAKISMKTEDESGISEELREVLKDPLLQEKEVAWDWFKIRM